MTGPDSGYLRIQVELSQHVVLIQNESENMQRNDWARLMLPMYQSKIRS